MSGSLCSPSAHNFTQSSPVLSAKAKRAFCDRIDTVSPILWRGISPLRDASPVISQATTPTKSPILKKSRGEKHIDRWSQASHVEILTPSTPAPSILNETIVSITESSPGLGEQGDSNLIIEEYNDDDVVVPTPAQSFIPLYTQAASIRSSGISPANLYQRLESSHVDSKRQQQKRKKYKKGGLALKLVTAMRLKRLDQRIGPLKDQVDAMHEEKPTQLLRVSAVKHVFSSVLVECQSFGEDENADTANVTLVFDEERWNRDRFPAGSTIRIAPPWETVNTKNGLTIFAPGNIKVLEQPRGDVTPPPCHKTTQVLQTWDCPCSSSEHRSSSAWSCAAHVKTWGLRNLKS